MPDNKHNLKNLPSQEFAEAQAKLDELCEQYDVKKFKLGDNSRRYKELVLKICGISQSAPSERGRKTKWDEEKIYEIGQQIEGITGFENTETGKKITKKEAHSIVATIQNINSEQKTHKKTRPDEIIRGVWSKYKDIKDRVQLKDRENYNDE